MKMSNFRVLIAPVYVAALLIFGATTTGLYAAGNGLVTGLVKDHISGARLPGANCYLAGTAFGAAADLNGEFRIINIPPGTYTLRVMYIGYKPYESSVEVKSDESYKFEISLNATLIDQQQLTITAQRVGQVAAINQQLTAEAIKNVVSAERIQEIPDANAAESVSRLPGISLSRSGGEGARVIVRGLSPKYNKISINGIAIPSTDYNNRSSDLSMITSENLASIEVFKALTPDMEADAIGGSVNLQLAKAKPEDEQQIRLYGAYNEQARDPRQYKTFARISRRLLQNALGVQASINSELRNRSSDQLSASYVLGQPKTDGTVPLRLTDVSLLDREEYRQRYGGSLILDCDIARWSVMLTNFYSRTNRDIRNRQVSYAQGTNGLTSSISNPDEAIDLLSNILTAKTILLGIETDMTVSHSNSQANFLNNENLDFLQERASLPIVDYQTVNPADLMIRAIPDSTGTMREAGISSRRTSERNYVASINFKIPYHLGKKLSGELKFGGRFRSNSRQNNSEGGEWWVYLYMKKYPIADFLDNDYDPHNFLDGKSSIGLILDPTLTHSFYKANAGNYGINPFDASTQYETKDRIGAGYLMTKLMLGQTFTFIPGVRYETFDGDYLSYVRLSTGHGTGYYMPRETSIHQENWLPMFHAKIKPLDWLDVRLAATRTLSRPDFIHLVPYINSSLESSAATVSQGNPSLKPASSWNYDAYVSFYQRVLGLFTAGWFYKNIDDVVVSATRFIDTKATADQLDLKSDFYPNWNYVGRQITRPENCPRSTVKGFELDLQTSLSMLPGIFKGFVVNANYTRIWSQTYFSYFKVETVMDYSKFPPVRTSYITGLRPGRVPGQADHIVNLSLGYDLAGFSARISMAYQGKSLASAYTQKEKDSWNGAVKRWDFSARYLFTKHLSAFLNGTNLTNENEGSFLGIDPRPTSLEYYGTMYDVGLQVDF